MTLLRISFALCLFLVVGVQQFCLGQNKNAVSINTIFSTYNKTDSVVILKQEHRSLWYNLYKKNISTQISANCQFEPTCSTFMNEGLHHKHSFMNFFLGIDRITRCGSADYVYFDLPSLVNDETQTINDSFLFYILEK